MRWTNEAGVERASTFDSERDALDFEARLRLLRRSNELASLDAGRETLAEFVQEWWKLDASSRLERATLKGYASHWNRHMLPRLGHMPLRDITPLTVTRFRAELEQAGVGDETIRRWLVLLQGGHDYRNWRRRHFEPAAKAVGLDKARPYDLRHSFASLMLHEGRVSIVDLASQLGHSPTMTLNTYGHVIAELREAPQRDRADTGGPPKGPREDPRTENAIPANQKIAPHHPSRRPDSNRRPLHYE